MRSQAAPKANLADTPVDTIRLVLIVTGSSAAMRTTDLVVELSHRLPVHVLCVVTHAASQFLNSDALRWVADEVITPTTCPVNPAEIAATADVVVVAPASADFLAAASLGGAGTSAQAILRSYRGRALMFPSLPPGVWDDAITREHVTRLRMAGHVVVDPPEQEYFKLSTRQVTRDHVMPRPEIVADIVGAVLKKPTLTSGSTSVEPPRENGEVY